jgi:demethylmenaquinone methyltransferase/2-methoxy-6-polyprenyl-1,4-benzoquinol methylase
VTALLDHSFGTESVTPDERERRIRQVFQAVAPRYDLMNDVMSFGIHRLWKRAMARAADPRAGQMIVDLAGGTGDVAALMEAKGGRVWVCDPSDAMMEVGRQRLTGRNVAFIEGSAEAMPFESASVDTLTIAFGLRNVTSLDAALVEIHRVLKPGGRFLCLEFSKPWALVRPFYDAYSYAVIPRLGAWVARQPMAYGYLVDSIRRFPDQKALAERMARLGFDTIRWRNLSAGIACLHVARKPA